MASPTGSQQCSATRHHTVAERRHTGVRQVDQGVIAQPPTAGATCEVATEQPTTAGRRGAATNAHRQTQFYHAARLHSKDASLSAISRQFGADRKTRRRWLWAGAVPTG